MTRTRISRAAAIASRIAALVVVGLIAGCPHDEYAIELTPQGDRMHRELTVSRTGMEVVDFADTEGGPEKLAAISEFYPAEVETNTDGGHAFAYDFAYAMPNDVGGAGEYITFDSPMGRSSAYVERFRGDDSPAQRIQAAFDAADELTDLVIAWLEYELSEYEEFAKLRAFLDEQARNDLKNLSIATFLLDSTSSAQWAEDDFADQLKQEVIARTVQYIVERQYILPGEVPAFWRGIMAKTPDGGEMVNIKPLLMNMLQRKADLQDEDMLAALGDIFTNSSSLEESLTEYLATTEAYQQLLAEWEQRDDESGRPEPVAVLVDMDYAMILWWEFDIFETDDVAKVTLREVTEPLVTNGLWDEKARKISWENTLNDTSLPAICYAAWTTPDDAFQKKRFGRTILDGKELLDYCLWYNSLTAEESTEWDAMIDQFKPGDDDSVAMMKAFRFSGGPVSDAPEEDAEGTIGYARQGIVMINLGLEDIP